MISYGMLCSELATVERQKRRGNGGDAESFFFDLSGKLVELKLQ